MIYYASQTEVCREKLILRYFGEKPKNKCGNCDVCRKAKAKLDKEQLLDFLKDSPKTIQEILLQFVNSPKESVLEALQDLADEGLVKNSGIDSLIKVDK